MATIRAATEERVFTATTWLGLNQAGDGDTNLKMGEASHMVNFRVTPDGALKKRPGMKALAEFAGRDYTNMWHGFVQGEEITVVSFDHGLLVYENGLDRPLLLLALTQMSRALLALKTSCICCVTMMFTACMTARRFPRLWAMFP